LKFTQWPKRDPIKNYFPLPNEMYHLGLSSGEIAIYGYLLSIENRKTYSCYPGLRVVEHLPPVAGQFSRFFHFSS